MPSNTNISETHPLFPSGEWEGFYVYAWSKRQHKMSFHLDFKNGVVTGSGGDDVSAFAWKGVYNVEAFTCKMVKTYPTHEILYDGRADENGIWGTWKMHFSKGGFHIWPKENSEREAAEEAASEIIELALTYK